MSALTRWQPLKGQWDPLKDLEEIEKRLLALFVRRQKKPDGDNEVMTVPEWSPLVDISEDQYEYTVKAELPEVRKEDVKLTVQDDVLCISGERKPEKAEQGKRHHRMERAHGSFMRSFTLPDDADGTKVGAEYKDGILKVHLPKSKKAQPQYVEVKVA